MPSTASLASAVAAAPSSQGPQQCSRPRRRRTGAWAGLLVAALAAAGCADQPARWGNPDASEAQAAQDRNACRARAEEIAARQLDTDMAAERNVQGSGGLSGGSSLTRDLAVADARDLRQRVYEKCLRGRGYRRTESGESD